MAEHFHLLASIEYTGCYHKDLEYTKLKIIENIKHHSKKAQYKAQTGTLNIFQDNIEYSFSIYNPYTEDHGNEKSVYYNNLILNLYGNNYNVSEEYWLTLFEGLLKEKEFLVRKCIIQLNFHEYIKIINQSILDETYQILDLK